MKIKAALFVVVAMFATLLSLSLLNKDSAALSGSDFNPGRIIDDAVFYNSNSMDANQIQTFLNSKRQVCDTDGSQPASDWGYPGISRAQLAERIRTTGIPGYNKGNPDPGFHAPPYTCLKDYRADTPQIESASGYCSAIPAGTNQSAAQMIYSVAKACGINPQVFIVLLEKEQSLVTDVWPLSRQFRSATGFACPDTADCDPAYAGLFQQLYNAGKQFKIYQAHPTHPDFNYRAGRSQRIYYQTNLGGFINPTGNANDPSRSGQSACGYSNIYIENQATAALYIYTPYQPNQAALANLRGTGDACSAYGNRNFWRLFNDWFGSTLEPSYTPFFQLPGSVTTYVLGANNTYYTIGSYQRLQDYGFEGPFKLRVKQLAQSALSGYTHMGSLPEVARFEGVGVYLMLDGKMRVFPNEEILTDYGYAMGQEATLPKEMADILSLGDPLWTIAGTSGGGATYHIVSGKKQAMCTWDAYTKLGTPIYSTRSITSLPERYLSRISNGAPIAMDGDVVESSDKTTYGVWSNGQLIPIDASTARSSGTINCGVPLDAMQQLPKSLARIDNLVSSSAGTTYVIEGKKKLAVNHPNSASLDIPTEKYTPVTSAFLDKLPTEYLSKAVRINNGVAVYIIHNGKAYGVPTEQDLFGLGYSFGDVKNISTKTSSLIPKNGLIFKPGSIARESSSLEVYLIDSNFKRHYISSEALLFNYGYQWKDVRVIPSGSFAGYTKGSPLGYYIKENDSLYWLMDRGIKKRILTDLIVSNLFNITSANYVDLSVSVLKLYPMTDPLGTVFRSGTSPAVYIIENGTKRAFTNEGAFFARGFTWKDVSSLNPSFVNSLPNGAYITH